jgi:hypothetical protein
MHGAGAAKAGTAPELGSVESQVIAQNKDQRRLGIDMDVNTPAVDRKIDHAVASSLRVRWTN